MTIWMRATASAIAAVALLAGCASEAPKTPQAANPAPTPQRPPVAEADQCGAREAQAYVGRSRSDVPVPVQPSLQRVACTTCPMTMDYNPRRLNFLYDAETGIIREVKCG
jgi:hypothetical protein